MSYSYGCAKFARMLLLISKVDLFNPEILLPMKSLPRIALSTGEPAGIGPDLAILLIDFMNKNQDNFEVIVLADPKVLEDRARLLGKPIKLRVFDDMLYQNSQLNLVANELCIFPVTCAQAVKPGELNVQNSSYVMKLLDTAIDLCQKNICQAMVTCPIQKSILIEAGFSIQGHTEYLAEKTHTPKVVMMLASDKLRVALVTTHLPLNKVSEQITEKNLADTITILHDALVNRFGIPKPNIFVCGLNPHAGEGGHLGKEEQDIMIPCLNKLRQQGINLQGPLSADTIFSAQNLAQADAFLAMYHDQGLPVLKALSFGESINITLGLPLIRTSVDHGTALPLAGTGSIDTGSLQVALLQAQQLISSSRH